MLENVECFLRKYFLARRNPYSSIVFFFDACIDRQYVVTLCLNVLPLSATSTANYPKLIDYQVHICTGEYHEVNASCSSSIQLIGCTSSIPAALLALLQISAIRSVRPCWFYMQILPADFRAFGVKREPVTRRSKTSINLTRSTMYWYRRLLR